MKKLKIYFTSDLHGYIYPTDYRDDSEKNMGLLNIINEFNKDGNTLIIDAGDTIQGSPFTNYLSNTDFTLHPIATIMNQGKYDYVTLGNHDFNYGYDYLEKYINNLDAKCLCTNVVDKTNDIPILPCDIKTLENGLKVGVIGFTTDFINRWERPSNLENFTVSDTFTSINSHYDKIKNQCDILIGIYHGGFEYDLDSHKELSKTKENIAYKLCKEFDFDILLTGHQHMEIHGHFLHGTYIAQTPPNGTKFLELNLELNENLSKNISSSLKKVSINPNKEMYNKYLDVENDVKQWLDTPVGFLDIELQPTTHIDMALNGSYLANFINQIQLAESGADISVTSFANSIKGFNKNVTVRDITSTYMFPNTLSILEVSGKVLKLALERSASYFDKKNGEFCVSDLFLKPKVEHYNYDYFANLNYSFDLTKEVGNRVTSMKFKDKEITENDKLTLAMNNYRATGAGGYDFYTDCKIVKEVLNEMPDIIIDYFKTHKNVVVDRSKYLNVIY
ncbi:MAG: bifunctional UDP-sugar hydrolase/5'-nucleotidase [Clostridium sp.]|uniref:bifunctional metallophosphatase/5'-nucleotidase n=1 Tax=Clostridium sp. TaxID=1506 RepID=UPI003031EF18